MSPKNLVQPFGDDPGAGNDVAVVGRQQRGLPGGIEQQEFAPAFVDPFLDQFSLDAIFAEGQANEARMSGQSG